MTRQPRVAVVGAGLAGLTAGLALARRGWRVDLYERSRLLGGKATSFEVDGHEVDCGQHGVLACCTATLELIEELGLSDSLYIQSRFEVTVLSRNRPPAHLRASDLPAPLHLMAGFARYPHLTTLDRILAGADVEIRYRLEPIDDLLDVSGMPRRDALRVLARLMHSGSLVT